MYRSPGYGVEIYYAESGIDAPDSTDNWKADSSEWRKRLTSPNGIPDYIDEVAWAIDSAWSMEIDTFGFPAPLPFKSTTYSSDNYKVVIESLESNVYGTTYPLESNDSAGFRSLLTIRNTWKGWNINKVIDYETHPEKSVRITCTHEFFHAIQYRMTHRVNKSIYLDDFPVSWLEGNAVMMEELAFPDINDYTQYSGYYFKSPTSFSVFSRATDESIYSNALVCMYLYRHLTDPPHRMAFFREIMDSNFVSPRPFDTLLSKIAVRFHINWAAMLNDFHVSSFFTEKNSRDSIFIDDAPILPRLNYTAGNSISEKDITKTVNPRSVQILSYIRNQNDKNILKIKIANSAPVKTVEMAVGCILHHTGSPQQDSIIHCPAFDSDSVLISVDSWRTWNEIIVVITNGIANNNQQTTTRFTTQAGPATPTPDPALISTRMPLNQTTWFLLNGRTLPPASHAGLYSSEKPSGDRIGNGIVIEKSNCSRRRIMHVR
jgi:hypothetical protein